MPFIIVHQDITRMHVDAIVNAANNSLLGGGGVDGAIHRAAGPALLAECRTLGGCETGQAKLTGGYGLPCKYVIHTVGPIWRGGNCGEAALLARCYQNALALALAHGCETVAFPLISSGVYGYPRGQAMGVAAAEITRFLENHDMTVYMTIFSRNGFEVSAPFYREVLGYINDVYEDADHSGEWVAPRRGRAETRDTYADATFMADLPACAPSLDDMLAQVDESFSEALLHKIDEKGLTDAQCYRRANIDRRLFNKIKNNPGYRPGKQTVLAFAIALELTPDEARELLMKAGYALSHSSKTDIVVEYCLTHGNYDIFEINEVLFKLDLQPLGY